MINTTDEKNDMIDALKTTDTIFLLVHSLYEESY